MVVEKSLWIDVLSYNTMLWNHCSTTTSEWWLTKNSIITVSLEWKIGYNYYYNIECHFNSTQYHIFSFFSFYFSPTLKTVWKTLFTQKRVCSIYRVFEVKLFFCFTNCKRATFNVYFVYYQYLWAKWQIDCFVTLNIFCSFKNKDFKVKAIE
jgi:hypothetical protein